MDLTAIRERLTVQAIHWAPKGLCSAAVGWGARTRLPRPLRGPTYRIFSQIVGARPEEAELPLEEYPSLSHFFARRLRSGIRQVDGDETALCCPCDGVIAALGEVTRDRMIQAKGKDYSLTELLMDEERASTLAAGTYVTIYLSPRDYHRVHAPVAADLIGYDYVPGTHFPVNPLFSRSVNDLMANNERVVFHFDTEVGALAMVMVAALGVSNIEVAHDRLQTRYLRRDRCMRKIRFDQPAATARGAEVGTFNLGSTTIMVFQPNTVDLSAIQVGDSVRFGQSIGQLLSSGARERSPQSEQASKKQLVH